MENSKVNFVKGGPALLLIDVINDFDFPEAERLLVYADPMAGRIAALKQKFKAAKYPVVYVNDNFGQWRSDFKGQVAHCSKENSKGHRIVAALKPDEDDFFVLKPKHSGFHGTPLEILLDHLNAETLVLTGVASNICVLFTANDAYQRNYQVCVPADCVAANTESENSIALHQMQYLLKADIRPSTELWCEFAASQ